MSTSDSAAGSALLDTDTLSSAFRFCFFLGYFCFQLLRRSLILTAIFLNALALPENLHKSLLPVMVSFSIRNSAILSMISTILTQKTFCLLVGFLSRIFITSWSISDAVSSPQFKTARPSLKYWFSWVARPIRPNFLDIPYWVTIALAILVACLDIIGRTWSLPCQTPVLPLHDHPKHLLTWREVLSRYLKYFSSSGTCITYPNAPIVRGTMVIFCTGSESFCRALTNACPTSW